MERISGRLEIYSELCMNFANAGFAPIKRINAGANVGFAEIKGINPGANAGFAKIKGIDAGVNFGVIFGIKTCAIVGYITLGLDKQHHI